MLKRSKALAVCITATAISAQTQAQAQNTGEPTEIEEVVVTGTLIEGIDPVGANVIGFNAEEIQETGASSGADIMRRVTLDGNFNSLPLLTADASIPFSPVKLRNLDPSSATLVLLDGNRVLPTGLSSFIDPDIFPAGILERVDIIPDGSSSTYGSDAVAGIVNFVTKKKVDGPSLSVRYGSGAGSYDTTDVNLTGGLDWDGGSMVASYAYSDRSVLLGKDLDYRMEDLSAFGGSDQRSGSCNPGTITVDRGFFGPPGVYPLPGTIEGPPNLCSNHDYNSYFPEQERHSLFTSLTHEIAEGVELDLLAYWSQSDRVTFEPDNSRSTGTITAANPFFSPREGESAHDVAFSYEDVFGAGRENFSDYKSWQVIPTLHLDFSEDWSVRTTINLGHNDFGFDAPSLNGEAQAAALMSADPATALNPYNPATTNANVLEEIGNFGTRSDSEYDLASVGAVFEGKLMDNSAGEVRLAFGAEFRKEEFSSSQVTGPNGAALMPIEAEAERDITSVFGELYVPITDTLELSLAARFDDYDDVGDTTNPKLGVSWTPNDKFRLRGSWGTSFQAPDLSSQSQASLYDVIPVSPFPKIPEDDNFFNFLRPTIILAGTHELEPEESENFTLGADFNITDNLTASLTYFNIYYEKQVDQNASFFFTSSYYENPANAPFFLLDEQVTTPQAIRDRYGDHPVPGFGSLETVFFLFGTPYVVTDQRKQNFGTYDTDGIDFSVDWVRELGSGVIDASLSGSYFLSKDWELVEGSGFVDTLKEGRFGTPQNSLNMTGSLGWESGPLYVSGTVYYRDGADVGPESIDSFTTLSLFGRYRLNDNWTLTVNVDNVLDEDPPFRVREDGVAYISMPRLVQFGIAAQF